MQEYYKIYLQTYSLCTIGAMINVGDQDISVLAAKALAVWNAKVQGIPYDYESFQRQMQLRVAR